MSECIKVTSQGSQHDNMKALSVSGHKFGSVLSEEIENLMAKYKSEKTTIEAFLESLKVFDRSCEIIKTLDERGLNAFESESFWMNFEFSLAKKNGLISNGSVWGYLPPECFNNIINIVRMYRSDPNIESPSSIFTDCGHSLSLYSLYRYSPSVVKLTAKHFMTYIRETIDQKRRLDYHGRYLVRAFKDIYQNQTLASGLSSQGLDTFRESKNIKSAIDSLTDKRYKTSFIRVLRSHIPEVIGPNEIRFRRSNRLATLKVGKVELDASHLWLYSRKLKEDAQGYINRYYESRPKPKDKQEIDDHIMSIPSLGSLLYRFQTDLNSEVNKKIESEGVIGFDSNNGYLLRWLYERSKSAPCGKKTLREAGVHHTLSAKKYWNSYSVAKKLLEELLSENININQFNSGYIKFEHAGRPGQFRYADFTDFREKYPQLFSDLLEFKQSMSSSNSSDSVSNVTLYTMFREFAVFFRIVDQSSFEDAKKGLEVNGIRYLSENNNRYLHFLQEKVQSKFKSGEISAGYAQRMMYSVRKLFAYHDVPYVEAYPINLGRVESITKTQPKEDYYDKQEIIEIAYHIEKCLSESNLKVLHRLWLYVARVIIKTSWNLSCVLNLAMDDFVSVDSLDSKRVYIRLFKPRAGYKTQWYKTDCQSSQLDGYEIQYDKNYQSATHDLIFIRDYLTASIRGKLGKEHPYKKNLMIFDDGLHNNGETYLVTESSFKKGINGLLKEAGCSISYSPRRVRKGGLNYLYRVVKRDFNKYKEYSMHSYQVFIDNYLRIDAQESEYKISKAVAIMSDYFNGRELSTDIVIVTTEDNQWLRVPNGRCTAEHNIAESSDERCASFDACLWCKHYRCLAHPESVHRLLSYREYVLTDMKDSMVEQFDDGRQQEYWFYLNGRVDEIINELSALNPEAVRKGEDIFNKEGMHPDWRMSCSTILLAGEQK